MTITIQQCQQLTSINSGGTLSASRANRLIEKGLLSFNMMAFAGRNRFSSDNCEVTELGHVAIAEFNKLKEKFPIK